MDVNLAIAFLCMGFVSFLIAWYEERKQAYGPDDEDQQFYMVVTFFGLATFFFIVSGVTLMFTTYDYVNPVTQAFTSELLPQYWPYGWFLVGLGAISLILLVAKIIDIRWK